MSTTNARLHVIDENGKTYDVHQQTSISDVEGLQTALNEKANVSSVISGLASKVDKEEGKGLSANDYTTSEKNKLAGIATGATAVIVDSVLSAISTNAIQNKTVYTALEAKANISATTKIFDNVNLLKADSSLSNGQNVKTLGHSSINDGGGAYYKIVDTLPSSGWYESLNNGKYALLCVEDVLNLKQCGIKSNEDIYLKLYDVFKKCHSVVHRYYLPAGYYIVSDCVIVPPNSEFYGDGPNTEIYYNAEYSYFGMGLGNGGSNVYFHDFKINHENTDDMWIDETIRSFLGGIGLSSSDFDSWEPHSRSISTLSNVKNLIVRNIWSDSYYPVQTEPPVGDYAISDVLYDNIIAPNGLVSLYANSAETQGFVQLDNCVINKVHCKLLRVGQNAKTTKRIFVSDVWANMIALVDTGIQASNLHIDYKSSMDIRRYTSLLTLGGDDIEVTNAYLHGAGEAKRGISLYSAGTVLLNNITTRNINIPLNTVSDTPNQKVMLCNCDFEGRRLMTINEGYVSNVDAFIEPNNNVVNRKQLSASIAPNSNIEIDAKMCTVIAKRNDSSADSVANYVISNLDDGFTYKAILESEDVPVSISRNGNGNIVFRNTGTVYYYCMFFIY